MFKFRSKADISKLSTVAGGTFLVCFSVLSTRYAYIQKFHSFFKDIKFEKKFFSRCWSCYFGNLQCFRTGLVQRTLIKRTLIQTVLDFWHKKYCTRVRSQTAELLIEAVVQRYSVKMAFLEILWNSQENTFIKNNFNLTTLINFKFINFKSTSTSEWLLL